MPYESSGLLLVNAFLPIIDVMPRLAYIVEQRLYFEHAAFQI
jgi:hypothetical protein